MTPISEDFTKAVQDDQGTDIENPQPEINVPETVESPYPHPVPSWAVQTPEHFAHRQERTPDAFDQIDAQQMTLSGRFSEHSRAQEKQIQSDAGENEQDEFDRVDDNAALSDRFNTHARSSERG